MAGVRGMIQFNVVGSSHAIYGDCQIGIMLVTEITKIVLIGGHIGIMQRNILLEEVKERFRERLKQFEDL